MSRHGYCDDNDDNWSLIRWRGVVASAIRGKRGQRLLRDMAAALDAMPQKRLVRGLLVNDGEPEWGRDIIVGADELVAEDGTVCAMGDCCALGAVAKAKQIAVDDLDPEDSEGVAERFDVADALVREITWVNDEQGWNETPEQRWIRVRNWVERQLQKGNTKEKAEKS